MAESRAHRSAKRRAAGPGGRTEVRLPSGRRLDAVSRDGRWGTEVETSGNFSRMMEAVSRLAESDVPHMVLTVPQRHMAMAAAAARKMGVSVRVRNMYNTRGFFVDTRRKRW